MTSRNYTAVNIGDDSTHPKSTSLWRCDRIAYQFYKPAKYKCAINYMPVDVAGVRSDDKWKRTTSYQKKVVILIVALLLLMTYAYHVHGSIPSNDMVLVNAKKSNQKLKLKSDNVEDEDIDSDLQVQHPILEQLGAEKQQVLRNLEDRLQKDIDKLNRPIKRVHPKLAHRKFGKDTGSDKEEKGDLKMIPADLGEKEQRKHFPKPVWNAPSQATHNERQRFVVGMFKHAWKGYKDAAWGHDHLHPISHRFDDWFRVGLTILDSLDTSFLMGLETEFNEARDWIAEKSTFNVNVDVNLFECTIRVLGSMLSAFHLTNDELFKDRAIDIGNRLLPALTKSVSPVPFSDVNLMTGNVHAPKWGPDSTVSEVTTIQLEFRDLTFVSGNTKYKDAVDRVTAHVEKSRGKKNGLVPMWINANTGLFRPGGTLTVGARADSYYEYLLKQWVQTNLTEQHFLDTYLEAMDGIKNYLIGKSVPNGYTYVGELINGVTPSAKMDHLVCFLPGTLALGATLLRDRNPSKSREHMELAKELIHTCYKMYDSTPTGLSPEITYFNLREGVQNDVIVKPMDRHNLLRPETVESLFYMWRITKDEKYREWGWKIAQAFEKYSKVPSGGYTSIKNVMDPDSLIPMDKMESFFLGETLKYLFLLFSDDDSLLSTDKWVFNTEAHPFPIVKSAHVLT